VAGRKILIIDDDPSVWLARKLFRRGGLRSFLETDAARPNVGE